MSLDFYRTPVEMTAPGRHAAVLKDLPRDVKALAAIVQGVMVHEHMGDIYGTAFTPEQHGEAHLRRLDAVLDRMASHRPNDPLAARPPAERTVGVCRHFTLLHVALLRAQGTPARARCGFGGYFTAGKYADHWVSEYWDEARRRWILVDSQVDARQREAFGITIDLMDVPRDRFLVAGDAWQLCRAGKADPRDFGIFDMQGLWFIASNVIRDLAALNNREMLPWDVWGAMTPLDAEFDLALIDRLAALTHEPDAHFETLRAVYENDTRLKVPATVFNHVLQRQEAA